MTKRSYFAWLWIGLSFVAVFAAGLYVGVIVGVNQFHKWESAARASVLTTELRGLRAGNVDKIIQVKEIELDGDVVSAVEYQKSGFPWLFWPYAPSYDQAQTLKRVAQYRKQYPSVAPQMAPPPGARDPADLRGFAHDVSESTKVLIRRYGN